MGIQVLPCLRFAPFGFSSQKSRNEVAAWCHDAAVPGMDVAVRAGGSFSLHEPLPRDYVFIAGGVGINQFIVFSNTSRV